MAQTLQNEFVDRVQAALSARSNPQPGMWPPSGCVASICRDKISQICVWSSIVTFLSKLRISSPLNLLHMIRADMVESCNFAVSYLEVRAFVVSSSMNCPISTDMVCFPAFSTVEAILFG